MGNIMLLYKNPPYAEEFLKEYYAKQTPEYWRKYRSEWDHRARIRLFELLGGVRCCNPNCRVPGGMDDPECLQIDHINGGGVKELKSMGSRSMVVYYLKHPDEAKKKLQVLCANCNWKKRYQRKEYSKKTRF